MVEDSYIQKLLDEKYILEPHEFAHTIRLLENEIIRARSNDDDRSDETPVKCKFKEEIIKLSEKVIVPVEEYPKFNFVGKLLGPKGNTLKRLQGSTQTRISILGHGSTRNKDKEEELSASGDPKHEHLKEPLHVLIEVEAVKSEAHIRLGNALAEICKYLVPENDELRQKQMREMAMLASKSLQKPIDRGIAPLFTLPSSTGFALNELRGTHKDVTSYDKFDSSHNRSYNIRPESSGYTVNNSSSRKRTSNGYPVNNIVDSYGDY